MKYPVTQHTTYTVMNLSGEIDLNESPTLRKQILKYINNNDDLLIDLSNVEYIDSSGVASLVEGLQTARTKKINFALVGVSDSALQVLQLARLDSVFTLYESLEDVE